MMTDRTRYRLAVVVLALAALACSAPSFQLANTETPTPPPATATPVFTPTPAPTPTISPGWQTFHAGSLKLNLAYPPGWEVATPDAASLEVDQTGGDGWLQIDLVSGTGNNPFALSYSPGEGGDAILAALLVAARQDGKYPDAQPMPARVGPAAWVSEGHSDVHNEQTLIAAVGLADRALVFTGHGTAKATDWPPLSAVYRGIIASLEVAQ